MSAVFLEQRSPKTEEKYNCMAVQKKEYSMGQTKKAMFCGTLPFLLAPLA